MIDILAQMDLNTLITSALLYLIFGGIGFFSIYSASYMFKDWNMYRKAKTMKRSYDVQAQDQPVVAKGEKEPVSEQPLKSPTGTECVAYRWQIARNTRNSDRSGLGIHHSGQDRTPFYLNGDDWSLYLEPENADIRYDIDTMSTTELMSDGDMIDDTSSLDVDIDGSLDEHKKYIYNEECLRLDDNSFVVVKLTETVEDADYEIDQTDSGDLIITNEDVESVRKQHLISALLSLILGLVLALSPLIIYLVGFTIFLLTAIIVVAGYFFIG